MIVVFSTSSPLASVALFDRDVLVGARSVQAEMEAGGKCLRMLEEMLIEASRRLDEAHGFIADVGPGSFTGIKVGIMLAKSLGYAVGAKVGGVLSFDLIAAGSTSVVPSRKGEWFVRTPGQQPRRVDQLPAEPYEGYGPGVEPTRFPLAEKAGPMLAQMAWTAPEALVPAYLAEPSVSIPKTPYRSLTP